jgi:hypothetical protein
MTKINPLPDQNKLSPLLFSEGFSITLSPMMSNKAERIVYIGLIYARWSCHLPYSIRGFELNFLLAKKIKIRL